MWPHVIAGRATTIRAAPGLSCLCPPSPNLSRAQQTLVSSWTGWKHREHTPIARVYPPRVHAHHLSHEARGRRAPPPGAELTARDKWTHARPLREQVDPRVAVLPATCRRGGTHGGGRGRRALRLSLPSPLPLPLSPPPVAAALHCSDKFKGTCNPFQKFSTESCYRAGQGRVLYVCQSYISYTSCTYIHTYMHACIHTYMHAYIHACIHACMHAYIHVCMHAYIHLTPCHACMYLIVHTLRIIACTRAGVGVFSRSFRRWIPISTPCRLHITGRWIEK